MRNERGFALLAVMLVLALLGVVVTEFAFSMRLEASMVRSYKERLLAGYLAEAAVQQAMREVLGPGDVHALDDNGDLVFYGAAAGVGQTQPTRLPSLSRVRVPLGAGEFSYRITDEESRINLNTAPSERVDRLLGTLGLDKQQRDVINDSLQDWKDADSLERPNGAESESYYLKLPLPYGSRNGQMQDLRELLQIRGITREVFWGTDGKPGLADLTTVVGRNTVNLNTAPVHVLKALGFSDAEISDVTQTRVRNPYPSVAGRFAGRGLAAGSSTFRIEAEGLMAGESRARVVAIVQRRAAFQPGRLNRFGQPTLLPQQGNIRPPGLPPASSSSDLGVVILSWRAGAEPS